MEHQIKSGDKELDLQKSLNKTFPNQAIDKKTETTTNRLNLKKHWLSLKRK